MSQDNRKRALAEAVTLDAWHEGFTARCRSSDLHVDVVFMEGRIGEEPESPVRFTLRLKRAEVVVIVPPTEPAAIDKSSVSRDAPQASLQSTETRTETKNIKGDLQVGAKTNAEGMVPSLGVSASAGASHAREMALRITQKLDPMRITQIQTPDNHYAWVIEPQPNIEDVLNGRPWDANKQPRLKVNDLRRDRTKGIEPSIRVELKCRREDLKIGQVVLKKASKFQSLSDPWGRNRELAAQAVIRTRLFEAGLLTGEIDDPYATLTLSAIIAEAQ